MKGIVKIEYNVLKTLMVDLKGTNSNFNEWSPQRLRKSMLEYLKSTVNEGERITLNRVSFIDEEATPPKEAA